MAFGKANAAFVRNQWAVVKTRRTQPERPVEEQLARCGFEQVFSPDNFGYFHGGIVEDDSKLVGGNSVMAPDDKIAKVTPGYKLLRTTTAIDEADDLAVRDLKSPVPGGGAGAGGAGGERRVLLRGGSIS